jgi:hypothetical protein
MGTASPCFDLRRTSGSGPLCGRIAIKEIMGQPRLNVGGDPQFANFGVRKSDNEMINAIGFV